MGFAAPSWGLLYLVLRSLAPLCVFVAVVTIYAVSFENAKGLVHWDSGACAAQPRPRNGRPPHEEAQAMYAGILQDIQDAMAALPATSESYARLQALQAAESDFTSGAARAAEKLREQLPL